MLKNIFYDYFGFNLYLFLMLNQKLSSLTYLKFSKLLSVIFNYKIFVLYLPIIISSLILKFWKNRNLEDLYRNVKILSEFIFQYFTLCAVFGGLKILLSFERPFCTAGEAFSILDFANEVCSSSFPSGHTGFACIVAFTLKNYINSKYIYIFIATTIIILVGLSRIALAAHYPSDIIYSIVIASIMFIIISHIHNKYILQYYDLLYQRIKIWSTK